MVTMVEQLKVVELEQSWVQSIPAYFINHNAYEENTDDTFGDSGRIGHFAGFRRQKVDNGVVSL